jgi:hypothetical protein
MIDKINSLQKWADVKER